MAAATYADTLIAAWVARFSSDHFGLGGTVYLPDLEYPLQEAGHPTHNTTAYHPLSNGLVERAHHQLKESLKARLASHAWPSSPLGVTGHEDHTQG
jgi:hypothetical protein